MAKKGIALKKGKKLTGAKTLTTLRGLRGTALGGVSTLRSVQSPRAFKA